MKKIWIASFLFLSGLISPFPANATNYLHLQVNDVHGKPVPHVLIYCSGHGISGLETSDQGTTRIALPIEVQRAEPLAIELEKSAKDKWVFIQPWDGIITVPRSGWSVRIILARPGDRQILERSPGIQAVLQTMTKKIAYAQSGKVHTFAKIQAVKKEVSKDFGFTPQQIDFAATTRIKTTNNKTEKSVILKYQASIKNIVSDLSTVPEYVQKEKLIKIEWKVKSLIITAAGNLRDKLTSFATVQSGNRIGIQSAVDTQISVMPEFETVYDASSDLVTVTAILDGQKTQLISTTEENLTIDLFDQAIENYFGPRLDAAKDKYIQDKLKK